jgi:hypothetical protein
VRTSMENHYAPNCFYVIDYQPVQEVNILIKAGYRLTFVSLLSL